MCKHQITTLKQLAPPPNRISVKRRTVCKALPILFGLLLLCFGVCAADIGLSAAIASAQQKLDIPAHYTNFSTNIIQDSQMNVYLLSWRGESDAQTPGGDLSVKVDSQGRIIYFSHYIFGDFDGDYRLSSIDYTQALEITTTFLAKTCPEFAYRLQPEPVVNHRLRNTDRYYIKLYRHENGVPFYSNYYIGTVEAKDGLVSEFEIVWNDIERFPQPTGAISLAAAEEAFAKKIGFTTAYSNNPQQSPVLLISTRADGSAFINAFTGEITNTNVLGGPYAMQSEDFLRPLRFVQKQPTQLAVAEEQVAQVLSKAYQLLPIDASYTLADSRVLKDENNQHYYHILLTAPDGTAAEIEADGATGEITGFYHPRQASDIIVSATGAHNLAVDFLKRAAAEKYAAIDSGRRMLHAYTLAAEPSADYTFVFYRMENEIPYYDEGLAVTISATTGRVIAYSQSWSAKMFPPGTAYVPTEAKQQILSRGGYGLQYVAAAKGTNRFPSLTRDVSVFLVYGFTPGRPLYASMETGKLSYPNGTAYMADLPKTFADIAGHPYQNQIETLLSGGVINTGEYFYPDDSIDQRQFLGLMLRAFSTEEQYYGLDVYDIMVTERSVLSWDEKNDEALLTVGEAIRYVVRYLGYGEVAELTDTYKTSFVDEFAIAPENLGYAAIAQGLGLVQRNLLLPNSILTRGRACEMMYNLLTQ